jgi:hypothetical protein
MAKQTAVEWLVGMVFERGFLSIPDKKNIEQLNSIIKQAKRMEKEQITDAFYEGDLCGKSYYDKIYGKQ